MSLLIGDSEPELLESTVIEYDDAPSECTIYPADTDDSETTSWITAKQGSFCRIDARL